MLEVVEEGLQPFIFLQDICRDGVDFPLPRDELQNSGKKPPFFNRHLRGFIIWEYQRRCQFRQGIGGCIPATRNMENLKLLKLLHELLGRAVVRHQFWLANLIDVIDLPNDELGVSIGP